MNGLIVVIAALSPNVDFTSVGGVDFFALGTRKIVAEPPESETFGLPTQQEIDGQQVNEEPQKTYYRPRPRVFRWRWRK